MNYLQQILDALKAKFTGVSESVLDRIAKTLAKTVTTAEQVKTVVDGVTLQKVIDVYGDSRATEAQQTAVQNYEHKYGLKDGLKVETGGASSIVGGGQPQPGQSVGTQTPTGGAPSATDNPVLAQLKALADQNKALNDRLDKLVGERTTNDRKAKLSEVYNRLPESLRKGYERISVDGLSDDDFNKLLTDVTAEVGSLETTLKAKGAVFGKPANPAQGGGGTGQLSEEQLKAINTRPGTVNAQGNDQPF